MTETRELKLNQVVIVHRPWWIDGPSVPVRARVVQLLRQESQFVVVEPEGANKHWRMVRLETVETC